MAGKPSVVTDALARAAERAQRLKDGLALGHKDGSKKPGIKDIDKASSSGGSTRDGGSGNPSPTSATRGEDSSPGGISEASTIPATDAELEARKAMPAPLPQEDAENAGLHTPQDKIRRSGTAPVLSGKDCQASFRQAAQTGPCDTQHSTSSGTCSAA
mmetsp:Transcript_32197/g.51838  ORF Transcript_32197/g.51838 Transcript_32197/m.51838 type:complete len:158 (-) Transcript_32197:1652-2125(-)